MQRLTFIFLFSSTVLCAQTLPPGPQSVADAEMRFAATSKEQSTKAAFLAHLGADAIVFNQGEPVNGPELWKQFPENNGLLFWWPVWADIASSGDFGYTTGPYESKRDRGDAAPAGYGYYSSVWKKNDQGVWKVAIDMGIGFPKKEEVVHTLRTSNKPLKGAGSVNIQKEQAELLSLDRAYVAKVNEAGGSFVPGYLSSEARIHRTGSWPYTTPQAIQAIDETGKTFQYEQVGGEVAASGDMGYAYGKVKVTVTREGNTRELPLNYLRVWKKEEGQWRIVLDVVGG